MSFGNNQGNLVFRRISLNIQCDSSFSGNVTCINEANIQFSAQTTGDEGHDDDDVDVDERMRARDSSSTSLPALLLVARLRSFKKKKANQTRINCGSFENLCNARFGDHG